MEIWDKSSVIYAPLGAARRKSSQMYLDACVPAAFGLRHGEVRVLGSMSVCNDNRYVWNTGSRPVVGRKQFGPHSIQSVVQVSPSDAGWKLVRVDGSDDIVDVRIGQQVPANYCQSAKRQQANLHQRRK